MDYIQTEFLKFPQLKPWLWKRFVDDIFSFGQIQREILISFRKILANFTPTFDLPMKSQGKKINFLDVVVKIKEGKITTNFFASLRMVINIFIMIHYHLSCRIHKEINCFQRNTSTEENMF